MTAASQLKILWHLLAARVRGGTHKERLESFYAGQADGYDEFRDKLLHGRRELIESLPIIEGSVWIDIGAGTGSNAEYLGNRIRQIRKVYQVDLCAPLLQVAKRRANERGWTHVEPIEADATSFRPPEPADFVTFSYSLTMIPDWFAAVERAYENLKPGGMIGVVDFYVARKHPEAAHARHGWTTRTFWPTWFALDNVQLSADHLPYLEHRFTTQRIEEHRGKVPFLPLARAPYYIFVGKK